MNKVAKEFDEFLEGIVEEHAHSRDQNKNLVDLLLWIQKENLLGFPIGRTCIKALILDMFVGGTDTTNTVLQWAMTELLRHPRILKKLQEEVTEIAKGKPDISESDPDKMPCLKATIKESTLRLSPLIPLIVPRDSSQDTKIMGFEIPAGTMVMTNAWAIGRDPALWDEPEAFKPERFLNSDVDFKIGNDHFQLIPFGAGRRGCPWSLVCHD